MVTAQILSTVFLKIFSTVAKNAKRISYQNLFTFGETFYKAKKEQ